MYNKSLNEIGNEKMIKFKVIKDVEMNEKDGGEIIVVVSENNIERKVGLYFDFGESLCSVCLLDNDENIIDCDIESVFSEEIVERLYDMDFEEEEK